MTQRFFRLFSAAILGLFVLGLLAVAPLEANQGLFWLVEDNTGKKIYLLGSFHMGKPEFYPLRPLIYEAFDNSDQLILELDVSALNTVEALKIFDVGFNPPGLKLTDQLSPQTLELYNRTELPGVRPILNSMRPWMAAMTIESLALANLGFIEKFGLESHFTNRAKNLNIAIAELESPQEQVKLFTDMTDQEQDHYLRATVLELTLPVHPIERYAKLWQEGDAEGFYIAITESYNEFPELNSLLDRLITKRNHTLCQRLIPFFRREGQTFFTLVGAAHLVGPEGIPSLMAKAGYKVTRL
ncbi:MAG: TraB/GumN family protein [Deltaproteobacteria bacterium]|nr:TraB/GumN family protein [Deltaproteobacteria bacterium]